MLYVTTRNQIDTYTVHHALTTDFGADGGAFVPFRLPELGRADLEKLAGESFGNRLATILNLFFSAQLTGWDVDFCIGKVPVKLHELSQRIAVAECWHNPEWDLSQITRRLAERIGAEAVKGKKPSSWMQVAVRIAVLFATYGDLLNKGLTQPQKVVDVAVAADDFAAPVALWYARKMGLPVGNIICGCHMHPELWDLIHQNQMRTEGTALPHLERLIGESFGPSEAVRYNAACERGSIYTLPCGVTELWKQGFYAAVISADRAGSLIPSVYRTTGYYVGPQTALAYGALQDYRANTGENCLTLLLAERGIRCDLQKVAASMEMTQQELLRQLGE